MRGPRSYFANYSKSIFNVWHHELLHVGRKHSSARTYALPQNWLFFIFLSIKVKISRFELSGNNYMLITSCSVIMWLIVLIFHHHSNISARFNDNEPIILLFFVINYTQFINERCNFWVWHPWRNYFRNIIELVISTSNIRMLCGQPTHKLFCL